MKLYLLLLWLLGARAFRQEVVAPDAKKYYEFMGLSPDAGEADIRRSYKKLALRYHPDKGGDEGTFKFLQEAYGVLGNAELRANYDATGDPNLQSVAPARPQPSQYRPARPQPSQYRPQPPAPRPPAYRPDIASLFGVHCRKPGTRTFSDVFDNYCACDNGLQCKGPKHSDAKPGCLPQAKQALYHWMCKTCQCVQQNGQTPSEYPKKPVEAKTAPRGLCGHPSDTLENGLCVCHEGKVCMREARKRGCGQSDIHAYQPGCRACFCALDPALTMRCCKYDFYEGTRYEWKRPEKNWQGKLVCPKFPGQAWQHAEDHLCDQ